MCDKVCMCVCAGEYREIREGGETKGGGEGSNLENSFVVVVES